MISFWKQWFILEESMLEIDSATITPHVVLFNSGHVERFNDLMVKDLSTGKYYRADHLLEDHMEALMATKGISPELKQEYQIVKNNADDYSAEQITEILRKYGAKVCINSFCHF
jgi:glycyl-tRNA synthetase